LPEGWAWASLEDLASSEWGSITDGPFGSNLKTSHYTAEGPRVVRLQNIGDGRFLDERAHISAEHYASLERHHVVAGDLLIAALGHDVPRSCLTPAWLGPAIVKADVFRVRLHESVNASYISTALNSPVVRDFASNQISGIGRPRLNLAKTRSLLLPLPPRAEQDRIVDALDAATSHEAVAVDLLGRVSRRLGYRLEAIPGGNLMRRSLLALAVTGRLVPNGPNDEPASELLARILGERDTVARPRRTSRA
jgi:type I restriction enzyme S subunit